MKYPALPILAAYAAGAWIADALGVLSVYCIPLFLVAFIPAFRLRLKPGLLLLAALAGGSHMLLRTLPWKETDVRHLLPPEPILARVRGNLLETPRQSSHLRNQELSVNYLAEFAVKELCVDGDRWQPASGKIIVSARQIPPSIYAPQKLELAGLLGPPPRPLAEGLFDYRRYLARKGIYYRLKTDTLADWSISEPRSPPGIDQRFLSWAKMTLSRGLPSEDTSTRLLWSMTLGIEEELPSDLYEPFLLAGTMHVFAISGLHIALIGGVIFSVLLLVRVPRAFAAFGMILLLWGYTWATGWQPSAIRATVMATILSFGLVLRRPTNLVNSLLAAALLILAADPRQMFGASFQLSFFVVLAIAIFVPWLEDYGRGFVDRLLRIDPFLAESLIPPWKGAMRGSLRWVYSFAVVSIAASIGSLPLIAYYFHLVSLFSPIANLVVVPLSSLALAANVASLALVFPIASSTLNNAAWALMSAMRWLSEWTAGWSAGIFYVPAMHALVVAWCYLLLLSWRWRRLHPRLRFAPWALLTIGLCGAGYGLFQASSTTTITALPLSGGMSVFVDSPGRARDLLVDAGYPDSVPALTGFLKARGVNWLPPLVLTHGDIRHVGGAPLLSATFPLKKVIISPLRFRSSAYRKTIADLESNPALVSRIHRGRQLREWRVLHPAAEDTFSKADDGALVLLRKIHDTRVLLLSDLGAQGQETLLARHAADLQADVVIAGLAADGTALQEALLSAIRPRLLIVCDSEFPAQEKASAKLRERLKNGEMKVWFTSQCGAVTLRVKPGHWRASSPDGSRLEGTLLAGLNSINADLARVPQ